MEKKSKKSKMVKVSFRLTDRQMELLREFAKLNGVSMADIMRNAISKEVASRTPTINEK